MEKWTPRNLKMEAGKALAFYRREKGRKVTSMKMLEWWLEVNPVTVEGEEGEKVLGDLTFCTQILVRYPDGIRDIRVLRHSLAQPGQYTVKSV